MDHSQRGELTEAVERSSGSYELVLAAGLIAVVGYGIDRWVGTVPLFTLIFAFVGFFGAAASLYYRYQDDMNRESAVRAEAKQQGRATQGTSS